MVRARPLSRQEVILVPGGLGARRTASLVGDGSPVAKLFVIGTPPDGTLEVVGGRLVIAAVEQQVAQDLPGVERDGVCLHGAVGGGESVFVVLQFGVDATGRDPVRDRFFADRV